MSLQQLVMVSMQEGFLLHQESDCVRVTTHCIYPSGSLVQVLVRGGENTFVVSDDGAAISEIEAAGAIITNPEKSIRSIARAYGLECDRETKSTPSTGSIYRPYVDRRGLALAIALVANASKDAADYLFRATKIPRERDFKVLLRRFLETRFAENLRSDILLGHSNKAHKFEHLIHLSDGKRIIVDPVMHDPQSINARVVANMDVRLANYDKLEQRIVYDDEADWKPEDLSLLQVGSTTVIPFSRAADVLGRISKGSTSAAL